MIKISSIIILVLVFSSVALAQQQASTPVEQRLSATVAGLVLENTKLAVELESAKQTIAQLRAELDKIKAEQTK